MKTEKLKEKKNMGREGRTGVTHGGADGVTALEESHDEPGADETGRATDTNGFRLRSHIFS